MKGFHPSLAASALLALEVLYLVPMLWGWHAVPFHLFRPQFTGIECARDLPPALRHLPGNDATAVVMDYPNEYYTAQRLRRGELPWWNPEIGMGRAWIGNAQVHPFSPLLLPLVLHPSPYTYSLQFFLGSLICLAGAFLFLRRLDLGAVSAAAGAALWTWNPFTSATFIMSSAWAYWWLPWVLLGLLLGLRERSYQGWLLAAAGCALMVLCGQPETALLLAEAAGIVGLAALFGQARQTSWGWLARGALLAGVGALLLSAAQWVPVLEVLKDSEWYKTQGPAAARMLTQPLSQLVDPLSNVFLQPVLWAAPLLLVRRRPGWPSAGFGLALVFFLAFTQPAITSGPLFRLLLLGGRVPPLHGAELACVAAAALAALALSEIEGDAEGPAAAQRGSAVLACLAFTAWGLWRLAPWSEGRWMAALWLLASAVCFAVASLGRQRKPPRGVFVALAVLLATYPLATQQFRYPYFSGCAQPNWKDLAPAPPPVGEPRTRFWAQPSPNTGAPYLAPNLGLLSGLSDVRSSSVFNPPGSDAFSHAWGPGGYISYLTFTFGEADPELLSFLGVGRAALAGAGGGAAFRLVPLAAGPRAFFASSAVVVKHDAEGVATFQKLLAAGEIYRTAVVLSPVAGLPNLKAPGDGFARTHARITWERCDPERLSLSLTAPTPGILVILDSVNHLWRARVDGAPAPVLRTDVMFRGVALDSGDHSVEMTYDVGTMRWAIWLSLVAWLLTLGWAACAWLRRPSAR